MIVRYLLVLNIVLCTSFSFAADAPFSAFGISGLSCGKYLSEISTNRQAANAYSWGVAGFVTGTNLAKGRAVSTDNPAHEAWLKQYCDKNPLDTFAAAAIELSKELDKRRSH